MAKKGKMNFQDAMDLAKSILENNTPYTRNRNLIDSLFKKQKNWSYREIVYLRLAVIDSLYSTNMNKHVGGLEDLAETIVGKSCNDEDLKQKIAEHKKSHIHPDITEVLETKYGNPEAKASSLVSKYFYFLTGHKFPIEDKLLKAYVSEVVAYFGYKDFNYHQYSKNDDKSDLIKKLLAFEPIQERFDAFDNLVWLYGKLKEKSISLITNGHDENSIFANCERPKNFHDFLEMAVEIKESQNNKEA